MKIMKCLAIIAAIGIATAGIFGFHAQGTNYLARSKGDSKTDKRDPDSGGGKRAERTKFATLGSLKANQILMLTVAKPKLARN